MLNAAFVPMQNGWHIAIRADAGLGIGTGHVMRCLTLADGLAACGADIHFLCQAQPVHMVEAIQARGHAVTLLPSDLPGGDDTVWSAARWQADAGHCLAALQGGVDWLIVDHYALDASWECAMRGAARRVLVIDDLADRSHDCDLLLDQTYGRNRQDYANLAPGAEILCGAQYALLRPEFAACRPAALARREHAGLSHLHVSMGGVDKTNATGAVLTALANSSLPGNCRITVVMGRDAPWLGDVREQAAAMPVPTSVLCEVTDMASLMGGSDLAIGAAGSTSWERCCLGLPSIVVVIAENQRLVAEKLAGAKAAACLSETAAIADGLPVLFGQLAANPDILREMASRAAAICDGDGVARVIDCIRQACDA